MNTAALKPEHNFINEKSVVDRHHCHMDSQLCVFVDEIITSFVTLVTKRHKML